MSASFQVEEAGLDHALPMPNVPPPEALIGEDELQRRYMAIAPEPIRRYWQRPRPIEFRPTDLEAFLFRKPTVTVRSLWVRATERLPDDADLHVCVLAYASDLTLLDASLTRHGRTLFEDEFMAASLDHALWLHRPFRADDWLLYAQDSPNLHGSRGFARGLIFKRDGTLVASVAQEGLVRLRRGGK